LAANGSMTDAGIDGLVDELVSWAVGSAEREAAVLALTSSAWLEDQEFVRVCVVRLGGRPPIAAIDWVAAREFLTGHSGDPEAVATLQLALDLAASGT
jgi:hypothetical protein